MRIADAGERVKRGWVATNLNDHSNFQTPVRPGEGRDPLQLQRADSVPDVTSDRGGTIKSERPASPMLRHAARQLQPPWFPAFAGTNGFKNQRPTDIQ
jgi:hypothetical protein